MRVAAIYDIHGNLPALEAVLDEINQAGVDQIVVGGDVLPGPMPHETLTRLLNLKIPAHFIQGNGESEILAHIAGQDSGNVPERFREIIRWVARQIPSNYESELAGWPLTFQTEIDRLGQVLFCHATPRNNTEIFTRLTAENHLLPIFEGLGVSIVVCGHTHMQFDRKIGKTRVVNAGSVGMPYSEPGAYWLLLGDKVELCHTRYDLAKGAQEVRATDYPMAEDFAANNILHPPTEAEALEMFSRAELK